MKPLLILALIITCLVSACNNKNKTPGTDPAATTGETPATLSATQEKIDALEQLKPYTLEEMQAYIPAVLAGDSASSINTDNNMGTGFAEAVYQPTDSTSIELSLFDLGGSAGAGLYNARFVNEMTEFKTELSYSRVIDFKGGKAIERMDGNENLSSLTWIANNRLLVELEGKNIGTDELKKIAGNIRLK
jgi:hypothetical protein